MTLFTRLDVVQRLMDAVKGRDVGPARIHAIALLVKKIVIFLCSKQSLATRHFIAPQTVASFQFIDGLCDEASKRRKMMQQDRTVLQIAATKDCRTSDKRPKEMQSLSTEDMRALVEGCLNYLRSDSTTANGYVNHLITLSFVILLGPRQQVFRQLIIGESLVKEGESYLIKLRSNQTKNGKAVLLQIPPVLTAMYDPHHP